MCPHSTTRPLKLHLTTAEHPSPDDAYVVWQHILHFMQNLNFPSSAATYLDTCIAAMVDSLVPEYVAAMLDSLVHDSLDDRARLADLKLLSLKMRKSYKEVTVSIASGLDPKKGTVEDFELTSWMWFHHRVIMRLDKEAYKLADEILRKGKGEEVRAELEMDEREWVVL